MIKNKTKKYYVVVDNSQTVINNNDNSTTFVLPIVQGTKQTVFVPTQYKTKQFDASDGTSDQIIDMCENQTQTPNLQELDAQNQSQNSIIISDENALFTSTSSSEMYDS